VVANTSGDIATIPELTPVRARRNDGRTTAINAIAFVDQELGFAAGDEGTFLQTSDGGITWDAPAVEAAWPAGLADFQTMFHRDEWIWIAGNPGGQVFRYRAGDRQWQRYSLPASSPVTALFFADSINGWCATVLGDILGTRDGGETWSVQRRGARGTALLQLADDPSGFSAELYSRFCHEQGYLGGAILFPAAEWTENVAADDCSQALGRTGSSFLITAPRSLIAGLHLSAPEENGNAIREYLVRQIRSLQPRVIVVSPRRHSGSDRDLRSELVEAVREAALPECFPQHFSAMGLSTWQVSKVLLTIDGGGGDVRMSSGEYLPQTSCLLGDFSVPSRVLLGQPPFPGMGATFQTIHSSMYVGNASSSFMEAIERSDSRTPRRKERRAAEGNTTTTRLLAGRGRQIEALLATQQTSLKSPADFAARLATLCGGLDDATAGIWLMETGEKLTELGKLALAQDVFVYFVNSYPRHPMVVMATRRLYENLSSAEASTIARVQMEQQAANRMLPELSEPAQPLTRPTQQVRDGMNVMVWEPNESVENPDNKPVQPAGYVEPLPGSLRDEKLRYALAASQSLNALDPGGLDTMGMSLSRIRLNSLVGAESSPETWLKDLAGRYQNSPSLVHAVTRELVAIRDSASAASSRFGTNCYEPESPPWLDAWLDDPVWKGCRDNSSQLQLTDSQGNINATLLIAADKKFVYIAGTCSKSPGVKYAEFSRTRSRDPEVASGDRVSLCLDTDRDYLTCFELVFESSGLVAERCGPIRDWNPELYVANRQDDQFWYFEAAIPVNELFDEGSDPLWAVSAKRHIRNQLASLWRQPERSKPAASVYENTHGQPGNTTTEYASFDNWALVLMPWQTKAEEATPETESGGGSR
jgi:Photosynthesis system II assembly factor YCF48